MNARPAPAPHTIQRSLSVGALVVVAAIAWAFLVRSEVVMRSMAGEGPLLELMRLMMEPADPGPYFFAASLMWVVMMIGMMTPAVVPMVMVLRGIDRVAHRERDTLLFAGGYLLGWSAFGVGAALLQLWLHRRGDLSGMLLALGGRGAGGVLLAAGVYQLSPWKEVCLRHCRSPMGFFLEHWSPGARGAVAMGLRHGLYCVGCCWLLMLLMFVGGAMSVLTMAALCALILGERLLPPGPWVSRIPGGVLIAWGAVLLMRG